MITKEQLDFINTLRVQAPYKEFIWEAKRAFVCFFDKTENYDRVIRNVKVLMPLHDLDNAEQFSLLIGMNRFYMSRFMRKEAAHPTIETVRDIAAALKVKPSTLLFAEFKSELLGTVNKLESQKEGVK